MASHLGVLTAGPWEPARAHSLTLRPASRRQLCSGNLGYCVGPCTLSQSTFCLTAHWRPKSTWGLTEGLLAVDRRFVQWKSVALASQQTAPLECESPEATGSVMPADGFGCGEVAEGEDPEGQQADFDFPDPCSGAPTRHKEDSFIAQRAWTHLLEPAGPPKDLDVAA